MPDVLSGNPFGHALCVCAGLFSSHFVAEGLRIVGVQFLQLRCVFHVLVMRFVGTSYVYRPLLDMITVVR